MEVTMKQESAQTCLPEADPKTQCQDIIEGLCCPIGVNNMNSPEVIAYLEALKAFQENGCIATCPPIPCPSMPQANCMSGGLDGTCVIVP